MAGDVQNDSSGPPDTPQSEDAAEGRPSLGVEAPRGRREDLSDALGDEREARLQEEIDDAKEASHRAFGASGSAVVITGGWNVFAGPVSGRDTDIGVGGTSVLTRAVSQRTVSELAEVYVSSAGYPDLQEALEHTNLVILRVSRQWGGTSAAICALSRLKGISEIELDGALGALPVEKLPKEHGFIVKDLSPHQRLQLKARDITALDDRLAKRRAKLVVVIDADSRFADLGMSRFIVQLTSPPPASQVVESHMNHLLGSTMEIGDLLKTAEIREMLESIRDDAFDVQMLVELAGDLAAVAAGIGTVEESLENFEERSKQDLEAWLDGIEDPEQLALVYALAVFNGLSYEAVKRAASVLVATWRPESEEAASKHGPRTRMVRSKRLQEARAKTWPQVRTTRYGLADVEVAGFVDEQYPARILRHVMQAYDDDQGPVLTWLAAMTEDVEVPVRVQAASAIGYLGRFAFDTIRRDILVPWAGSGRGDERENTVTALAVLAQHPPTTVRTLRLVHEWCGKQAGALRLTAARALGSSVGSVVPGGPDKLLRSLAEKAEPDLAVAIGRSLRELIGVADLPRKLELLDLLDLWSRESRRSGCLPAAIAGFLGATNLWTIITVGDEHFRLPLLLHITGLVSIGDAATPGDDSTQTAARMKAASLWGQALIASGFDKAVRRALRSWAWSAERVPALRAALASLLVETASISDRHARLVMYQARTWRDDDQLAPDLAARLLAALQPKA